MWVSKLGGTTSLCFVWNATIWSGYKWLRRTQVDAGTLKNPLFQQRFKAPVQYLFLSQLIFWRSKILLGSFLSRNLGSGCLPHGAPPCGWSQCKRCWSYLPRWSSNSDRRNWRGPARPCQRISSPLSKSLPNMTTRLHVPVAIIWSCNIL